MLRLRDVDLTKHVSKEAYKTRSDENQVRLVKLQNDVIKHKLPVAVVFEGWDAAGKGGTIRRMVTNLDPRIYRVHATAKPTPAELAHHYLWRFWTRLPKRGELVVFDRSWYGRVLVERVEKFATRRSTSSSACSSTMATSSSSSSCTSPRTSRSSASRRARRTRSSSGR